LLKHQLTPVRTDLAHCRVIDSLAIAGAEEVVADGLASLACGTLLFGTRSILGGLGIWTGGGGKEEKKGRVRE